MRTGRCAPAAKLWSLVAAWPTVAAYASGPDEGKLLRAEAQSAPRERDRHGALRAGCEDAASTSPGDIARSLSPHLWRSAARLDLEAPATARSGALAGLRLNGT